MKKFKKIIGLFLFCLAVALVMLMTFGCKKTEIEPVKLQTTPKVAAVKTTELFIQTSTRSDQKGNNDTLIITINGSIKLKYFGDTPDVSPNFKLSTGDILEIKYNPGYKDWKYYDSEQDLWLNKIMAENSLETIIVSGIGSGLFYKEACRCTTNVKLIAE